MRHDLIPNILAIAGSDPSGGAGIQADLKTIAATGGYGMAAITALTAQNGTGVRRVMPVPATMLRDQIAAIFDDIDVAAIKIGMLANAAIIRAVARAVAGRDMPVVLDPVMISTSGHALLPPSACAALCRHLLPLAHVLTPNLPEAAALLRRDIATDRTEMQAQAQELRGLGPQWVLLKGGHLGGDASPDLLAGPDGMRWFDAPRIDTRATHGTGCTLSSALATLLGRGLSPADATGLAKAYLHRAIAGGSALRVGTGHGPVDHLWPLRGSEIPAV